MAVGAVLVPVLAWLLMLSGGLTMRRRLRRRGAVSYRSAALGAVQQRFDYWCDAAGLTGRRRPTLLLGRPGRLTRQAYCIAVPLSRPIVVVPAGAAQALASLSTEVALCPQWSADLAQADDKRIRVSMTTDPPPGLPYPSYELIVDTNYRQNSTLGLGISVRLWSLVGHNLVEASDQYYFLDPTIRAARLAFLRVLASAAAAQIITSLKLA